MEIANLSAQPRRRVQAPGPLSTLSRLLVRLEIGALGLRESLREELLTGPLADSVRVVGEGGGSPTGPIVHVTSSDALGTELELDAAIGSSERSRALVFELMQAFVTPERRVRVRFSQKPRHHSGAHGYAAR